MDDERGRPRLQVTDRRFWAQTDPPTETSDAGPRYPSVVEELKARTEAAEQGLQERIHSLDEENEAFRLRLRKEMGRRMEQEKLDLLREFLEVADNLERALAAARSGSDSESLRSGMELTLQLMLSALQRQGIEPLNPLNQPFDPHVSEAIGTVPVEVPELDQKVAEVVTQGFRIGDELLRPAQVRVGQYTAPAGSAADAATAPGPADRQGRAGKDTP